MGRVIDLDSRRHLEQRARLARATGTDQIETLDAATLSG